MSITSEHPMDNIKVRVLKFETDKMKSPVWSESCPEFAIFINALGVHVPYFERYLIAALGRAKPKITDDKLRSDVSDIIGQEAHHAKNFIDFNKYLADCYPRVQEFDDHAKKDFASMARKDDLKRLVGFTAGYETFTFLAGMIILDNYERWMHDANPTVRALWVWHQVEEVEHGAVAFEAYQHLFGEHEGYRRRMVLEALWHIVKETNKAYFHMCKVEGYLKSIRGTWKSVSFLTKTMAKMAWLALPVLKRNYTPRDHPLVNQRKNPVGFAWRNWEDGGGEVLSIDKTRMAQILMYEMPD